MTAAGHDRAPARGQLPALELTPVADNPVEIPANQPLLLIGQPEPEGRRPAFPADRWLFLIVFLVALTIFGATDTGRIVFDTKLGVDIDAGEFLSRLWSLWNPQEWFGSLQDQYIGYAIPMAPFFLVGQLLHLPIWIIERLWLALLITVGFAGLVKLAKALNIGSDSSRLLAGVVFVLWPTFTIAIGSTSAAALPGLVAPWTVLPLIPAVTGRAPAGRAAARSGLAIAAMAGVNAVSTLAVLLLPALYIATHTRGRQRAWLSLKWSAALAAGTAWWVIPLLLQGRYSFNFLPYIEQAATTTGTISAAAVLRGTGTWTAYFNLGGAPWNTAGWAIVSSPGAIMATAGASAAGLAGLARRDMPERRWLCICVSLVALVALAGYYGPVGGPFHAGVDSLLDGVLAPFRSTYKFEPVIAVVLALGCAHLLQRCWKRSLRFGAATLAASAVLAPMVGLILIGMALPQLTDQALQPGSFAKIPAYWYQTSAYLAAHSARETALVVPANPHGQFTWGDTIDDPLEPLAASPWAERGLVPFGGAGSQVMLDTAEQAIDSGRQVPGLAAYLARAGIRYVVVRNDASPAISGYIPPQVVNETLTLSGFHRVAAFGPAVAAAAAYPNVPGETPGFAISYPSVEIFTASDPALRPASPVIALPVSSTALVNGGPDSLLQLTGQGILASQPAVISGQRLVVQPALWAVTDGQRRADTDFGSTTNYVSYTYTATGTNPSDDPLGAAGGQPRQLLPVAAAGHQTVAVLAGAASVTASSAGTWTGESTQSEPANAFDWNRATAWTESDPDTPVGQWIQINFGHPVDLPAKAGVELLFDSGARSIATQLEVTSAAGSATTEMISTSADQTLLLPPGPTRWMRITITGAANVHPGYPGAGITDVLIPGVKVTTYLQPPEDPAGESAPAVAYSFSQPSESPSVDETPVTGDFDRTFLTPVSSVLSAEMTAVAVPGRALTDLLGRLTPAGKSQFRARASSSWDNLPEFGAAGLFGQKPAMPWLAGASDTDPAITLSWRGRRTIGEIVLQPALGLAATPTSVLIRSPDGARLANVGLGGVVRISPPLRADRLNLSFRSVSGSAAGDLAAGQPAVLPVGLARVKIPALAGLRLATPRPSAPFRLGCGAGPALVVNGQRYLTSVSGTIGSLLQLRPVQVHLCTPGGTLTLPAGRQRLTTAPAAEFAITGLSLATQPGAAPGSQQRTVGVLSWQADSRKLSVGAGPRSYLEIHENANPGWTASMNGMPLPAVTLDGWQQAFVVPAGQGGVVTLTYGPAATYHAGIIAAAIALLILAGLALGIGRRTRVPESEPGPPEPPLTAAQSGSRPGPRDLGITHHGAPALVYQVYPDPHLRRSPPAQLVPAGRPPAHGRHRAAAPSRPRPTFAETRTGLITLMPLAAVIFVAGGPVAVAVPALAIIDTWRARWLPWIAGGAMLLAGVVAAAASTPTVSGSGPFSGPAQVFALVALAAALLPVLPAPSGPEPPASQRSQS
jgi:arabinofuranan 3-O-arabinosyltransferase